MKLGACAKVGPRNLLIFVGVSSNKHILAVAEEEHPDVIEPNFKTSVDDTAWRG